nr:CsgG/HfaB family protein [uncultured Holophaga sp.]
MHKAIPALALALALSQLPARAQFWEKLVNPEVEVSLVHPPSLGLKVQRLAFAPAPDRASEDLISACIADLSASGGLEILDRGNTERVLREQKFTNSGLVDEATAVSLGRLLGSPVMLFVKVQHLEVKHIPTSSTSAGWKDKKGNYHPPTTTYTSKTQAEFNASVQAVDLASGKVYAQRRIVTTPSLESHSDQGRPEYPSDASVTELAIGQATREVHQMLLSWTEGRRLTFYDDKDYGMKEAHKRLKLGDPEGALQLSLEAVRAARADSDAKPKYLGRTNYNAGICHFILGSYPEALPFLSAAREADPDNRIYATAKLECEKALKLMEEMSRVEARSGGPRAGRREERASRSGQEAGNLEERLQRLDKLRSKGLLTPEEYKAKKAEIMKDL